LFGLTSLVYKLQPEFSYEFKIKVEINFGFKLGFDLRPSLELKSQQENKVAYCLQCYQYDMALNTVQHVCVI